jgi:hypothetical protein
MVTVGSFCSSDPAPPGINQVVSPLKIPRNELPKLTINPEAMPAGTELSFGNFKLANGEQTSLALIDTGSYTRTSTAPATPPPGGVEVSFSGGGASHPLPLRQK